MFARALASSFSSETSTEHAPELMRAETKMSLERTSSFFWSSPDEFCSPAMPKSPAIPAFAHARDVALHARPSCAIRMVSCGNAHGARFEPGAMSCGRNRGMRVRVPPRASMSCVLLMSQRLSVMNSDSLATFSTCISTRGRFGSDVAARARESNERCARVGGRRHARRVARVRARA